MLSFRLKQYLLPPINWPYLLFVSNLLFVYPLDAQHRERHRCLDECENIVANRAVNAEEIAEAIRAGRDFCAFEVTIKGALNFSDLSSEDTLRIESHLCIINSIFEEDLRIVSTSSILDFNKNLVFAGSKFLGAVTVRSAIFRRRVDFKSCQFDKEVSLFNSEFNTITEFDWSKFNNEFICQLNKFNILDFDETNFGQDFLFQLNSCESISFLSSRFRKGPLFTDNNFCKTVTFSKARFDGDFTFTAAHSSSEYCKSQNKSYYDFGGTVFRGRTIFSHSDLDSVSFYHEKLPTLFLKAVDFSNVTFGSIKLENVFFDKVDFTLSTFQRELQINRISFSSLNIRWSQLKNLRINGIEPNSPGKYLDALSDSAIKNFLTIGELLEANFKRLGYLEDANKIYFLIRYVKGHRKSGIAWFFDRYVMYGLLGYLVLPLRIVRWSLLLILIFSILFFLLKGSFSVEKNLDGDSRYHNSLLTGPPVEYSIQEAEYPGRRDLRHAVFAFLLSFSIFTKFPIIALLFPKTAVFIPQTAKSSRILAMVEWTLAWFPLVLLSYSLRRTVPFFSFLVDKVWPF